MDGDDAGNGVDVMMLTHKWMAVKRMTQGDSGCNRVRRSRSSLLGFLLTRQTLVNTLHIDCKIGNMILIDFFVFEQLSLNVHHHNYHKFILDLDRSKRQCVRPHPPPR